MSRDRNLLRGFILAAGACLASCGGSAEPRELWRPWYERPGADPAPPAVDAGDTGRDAGSGGTADLRAAPGQCSLAVTVTTTSAGGRYSPRNIGAIWVSDSQDRFIKTLMVWAEKRAKYLQRWNAATAAALMPGSRVDAISSATKSSHGVRSASWNCADTASRPVPDGSYKVCFELTDYDGAGPYSCVSITKGPAPFSVSPPDSPSFTARKLELVP